MKNQVSGKEKEIRRYSGCFTRAVRGIKRRNLRRGERKEERQLEERTLLGCPCGNRRRIFKIKGRRNKVTGETGC